MRRRTPRIWSLRCLAPGPVGGKLWRNGAEELAPGDTFTQEELVNGAISFQDDGDATGTEGFKFEH